MTGQPMSSGPMTPRHVVLIGAARSGTKLLRDALAAATSSGKVPYDIGYVWRVGNESSPDDVLNPGSMSEKRRRFVRKYVDRHAAGDPLAVIEKTVGNALRLPMVASVLPDAKYIHLLRDGVDVTESTLRQWTAPADLRYLTAKARTFPLRLAPRYGVKYLRSLASRRWLEDTRVGSWGPRYPGIDRDLDEAGLLTVCARQWRSSVTTARRDVERLGLPVAEIRYERLVQDAEGEISRLADFVGLQPSTNGMASATRAIMPGHVGMGRTRLTADQLVELDTEVGDLLVELGYDRPVPAGARNRQG